MLRSDTLMLVCDGQRSSFSLSLNLPSVPSYVEKICFSLLISSRDTFQLQISMLCRRLHVTLVFKVTESPPITDSDCISFVSALNTPDEHEEVLSQIKAPVGL